MAGELPMHVRAAFGARGPVRRLPGGGGTCWQVGELVLKPGQEPDPTAWQAETLAVLRDPGFRVPPSMRAADGSWVVDGWAAWQRIDGAPAPLRRWPELVATSRALHTALASLPHPRWLGGERTEWAIADLVAWEDAEVELTPELADLVTALQEATRPVSLPAQLVHGDIAGNVLFADDQPPAVIDFSLYWRPAGYALAVAAVDVLSWSAAPPTVLDELSDEDEIDQLLLRALISRLVTESLLRCDPAARQAVRRASEPVVQLLLSRGRG